MESQSLLRRAILTLMAPPPPAVPMTRQDLEAELRAALQTCREVDPEMEDVAVAAFLDRVDRAVEARAEARLAQLRRAQRGRSVMSTARLVLLLAFAIPLTFIGVQLGLAGVLVAWAAIFALHFLTR